MRTTRKERLEVIERLNRLGISAPDAYALRRIAMTLHRWYELECGCDNGAIERDENTGKVFWHSTLSNRRYAYPDRETGALKRLARLILRYPDLVSFVQTDPRGASLYILRKESLADGVNVEQVYSSRGIAVY